MAKDKEVVLNDDFMSSVGATFYDAGMSSFILRLSILKFLDYCIFIAMGTCCSKAKNIGLLRIQ
jgi:hypothetical protein